MSKAREGWAYGTTDGGEWLTILGTHYKPAVLAATAEEAVRPAAADHAWYAERMILARVREMWHPGVASGRAYQILERG